jgi:hypothetical protein
MQECFSQNLDILNRISTEKLKRKNGRELRGIKGKLEQQMESRNGFILVAKRRVKLHKEYKLMPLFDSNSDYIKINSSLDSFLTKKSPPPKPSQISHLSSKNSESSKIELEPYKNLDFSIENLHVGLNRDLELDSMKHKSRVKTKISVKEDKSKSLEKANNEFEIEQHNLLKIRSLIGEHYAKKGFKVKTYRSGNPVYLVNFDDKEQSGESKKVEKSYHNELNDDLVVTSNNEPKELI